MSLTIILPAYNEERNIIRGCLTYVTNWVETQAYLINILVVNDGSTDNTGPIAARYICRYGRVISIQHTGKGAAITAGLREATGEMVLVADFDQSTPIKEIGQLRRAYNDGFDIVIGSRGSDRPGAPLSRQILARSQVIARKRLLGMTFNDTQCGFKLFDRRAALDIINHMRVFSPDRIKPINGPSTTSGWDVEFLYIAGLLGYAITEVPVVWHHQPTQRVRPIHDAIRGIVDLYKIRWAARYGAYADLIPTAKLNHSKHYAG